MKFQKGQVANPKGRPKGAKDKLTPEILESILNIIHSNYRIGGQFYMDIDLMEPFQRQTLVAKFVDKVLPTLVAAQIDQNNTGDIKISVSYAEDAPEIDEPKQD